MMLQWCLLKSQEVRGYGLKCLEKQCAYSSNYGYYKRFVTKIKVKIFDRKDNDEQKRNDDIRDYVDFLGIRLFHIFFFWDYLYVLLKTSASLS